jgi:serine/threonine protein kinase/WD40 repeat protein
VPTLTPQAESLTPLARWLQDKRPAPENLAQFARQLALQLSALHEAGRLHGSVQIDRIAVSTNGSARLLASPAGEIVLDGPLCPPELRQRAPLSIPADLAAAAKALRRDGESIDPRRIDTYQLGALLVQIATSRSVEEYLCKPQAAMGLPAELRRVLDRALGFAAAERLATCQELLRELPGQSPSQPLPGAETPSRGVVQPPSDTDAVDLEGRAGPKRAAAADELPFTRLGQYAIVARLGSGGMGDVYKGYDADLDRYVAIKVLPAELAKSSDFVARFRSEAAAAAKVEHPNIVPIYTIGADQGHQFFAMQLVTGQSLAQLLAQQPKPPQEQALAIVEQVVSGLAAAHRHGLVHRDIKPGNILLADGGRRALVADFGLVKSVAEQSRMTATGVVMGTVDYISPEQGRGKLVDGRSDLYSIGVLLYQMLAGRLPFVADSPTAMIFQHAYEPPPPLTIAAPDVGGHLAAVVHRLLSKSPDERHATCEGLLEDLRAIRAGQAPPHLPAKAGRQATAIIIAPQFGDEPVATPVEEPVTGWSSNIYQHAMLWLGRQAPQVARRLQNTQQQVDAAVFEYEQRCQSLARLVGEADEVQRLLAEQIRAHREAAEEAQRRIADSAADADAIELATADRHANQTAAAELEQQLNQQRSEVESMQLALAKAKTKLSGLQGQRDALNARLKIAQARYGLADARPKRRIPRAAIVAAAIAAVGLGGVGIWLAITGRGTDGERTVRPEGAASSSSGSQSSGDSTVGARSGPGAHLEMKVEVDAARQTAVFPVRTSAMIALQDSDVNVTAVVGAEDGTLIWCGMREGKLIGGNPGRPRIAHANQVSHLAWNPRTRRLASADSKGEVFVWSDQATILRKLPHGHDVKGLAFSPDGSQLLTSSHEGVRCWDIATASELDRYTKGVSSPGSLAWMPDGSGFVVATNAAGASESGYVVGIDGQSWRPLEVVGRSQVLDLALFEGGTRALAISLNGGLSAWNTADGSESLTFDDRITNAAYTAWGTRALTSHFDGTVALWDTRSGKKIQDVGQFSSHIRGVALSEMGETGAVIEGRALHVFGLPPEKVPGLRNRLRRKSGFTSICFSPTRFEAALAGADAVVTHQLDFDGWSPQDGIAPASTAVYSMDGQRLLVARPTPDREGYGTIVLQDLKRYPNPGGVVRRYRGHQGGTSAALFARNGTRVISGGNDNHLRLWETLSERELDSIDVGAAVRELGVTRDGSLAVIAGDQVAPDVWNLETKQKVGQLQGHSLLVQQIVVARNANVAVTISGDRTARVWDLTNLNNIATFDHPTEITAVDLSADGSWIVTGNRDGALRFWNVETKSAGPVMWAHHGAIDALALSHDNRTCVSIGADQFLCWWNVPEGVVK